MLSLASSLISCLIAFVDYYVCEEGMEEVEFSEAFALPSGASAAARGFERMSQALDTILTGIFGIP